MKFDKSFFTGKGEYLAARYRNLYGESSCRERTEREQKKIVNRYLTVLILFAAVLAFSIVSSAEGGPDMKTGDDGLMISVDRPAENESTASIDARVWAVSKSGTINRDKQILIQPVGENIKAEEDGLLKSESESDKLDRKISTAVRSLNDNTEKKTVVLPSVLDDGTKLYWKKEDKNNYPMIFIAGILLLYMVYKSRYDNVKKEEKAAGENVIREMPGFINKLVLLLDAGIVFNTAFEKIMADKASSGHDSENYFYDQMKDIYNRSRETNSPVHIEMAALAKRSGVREMMRMTGIITDNINKGTDLSEKLKREGEVLWFARKKQSEEKGRLAETKLTLPLVILLLVLVMITVAPALMDM
ncbi:MAG: type II secretion system F family protein [Eubacteriaceae bacterium]|nr:type II secretion system F family protein [Eubacteriaceae bacterium]